MSPLNYQQECEMIARGNHTEIMDYITKRYLSDEAEVALIRRGNHEEIAFYTAEYHLCDEAIACLDR